MNLHRTTGRPDWVDIDSEQRSTWQRLAAATWGVVTPGNVTTLVGLGLVIVGFVMLMEQQYAWAIALVAVGRLLDLVDGWLAELTKTKSPLGEFFDAAVDKIETVGAILVLGLAGIAPFWLLAVLVAPHIATAFIAVVVRARGMQLHPSRIGKLGMALLWLIIGGLIALPFVTAPGAGVVVYSLALLVTVLAVYATIDYGREAFGSK